MGVRRTVGTWTTLAVLLAAGGTAVAWSTEQPPWADASTVDSEGSGPDSEDSAATSTSSSTPSPTPTMSLSTSPGTRSAAQGSPDDSGTPSQPPVVPSRSPAASPSAAPAPPRTPAPAPAAVPSPAAAPAPTSGSPPANAVDLGYNPHASYSDQCTWYAEERMHQATGKYMPTTGDAWQWPSLLAGTGWTVGSAPALRSVAMFPRGAFNSPTGHVGWVVGIGNGTVRILDYNWNGRAGQVTDHWVTIPSGTRFVYSDR